MTQFLTPSESAELSRNGIDITDPALDFAAEDAEVERKLSALLGEPVRFYRDCPSTNDIADQLASEGWTGVVVADHQSAGRGRMGRSWSSETGKNLLFSVVLRPDIAVVDAPRQPLIWASLLAERLGVFVKWPNDLVDGEDRKVAGLLSSMRIQANTDRVKHIILGIGLNVNQEQFEALPDAVSLRTIHNESFARGIVLHGLMGVLRQAACLGRQAACRRRLADYAKLPAAVGRLPRLLAGFRQAVRTKSKLGLPGGLRQNLVFYCVTLKITKIYSKAIDL